MKRQTLFKPPFWIGAISVLITVLLPRAEATDYPLTITGLDGSSIVIKTQPQRIILQDGRDLLAIALLDRSNPFQRVVAWNNLLKRGDTELWQLLKNKWPEAQKIRDMGFSDQGEVNNETVLAIKPDLMVAQLRAKPILEQTGVLKRFKTLHIPVLFIDSNRDPIANTRHSIALLGKALNREQQASEYIAFYQQRLDLIQQTVAKQSHKPLVFIEPLTGSSENCCFTHGDTGWGALITAAGGRNIGSELLKSPTGFIDPEKIIIMKPDWYLLTGAHRSAANSPQLPFGYFADQQQLQARFASLIHRSAVAEISAIKQGQVAGLYHHFYNHTWNIIGIEILAKLFYPTAFNHLDPNGDYQYIVSHFTRLPVAPIILSYYPPLANSSVQPLATNLVEH